MILLYRWLTFLLAGGAFVYIALFGSYADVGGPFRFLTVWALLASFVCASRLVAQMEGRVTRRFDRVIAATAALNAMVAVLFFTMVVGDPDTLDQSGGTGAVLFALYLHVVGPMLQIFDAVVLHRAFRKILHSAAMVACTFVVYVAWIEWAVAPLNNSPVGSVTRGLPYGFLNNLDIADRAIFYGINLALGLTVLVMLTLISHRLPAMPAILSGSRDTAAQPPVHP